MQKNIINLLIGLVLMITNSNLFAQLNDIQISSDSIKPVPCGLSPERLKKMNVEDVAYNPTTLPTPFPAYAIIECGKFKIYYEDLITSNPQVGFSDAINGSARRNTLCAVLTYVQTVFDFSNIPAGSFIKLHVNESYAPIINPSPIGENSLAFAGPTFSNLGSPQILNGNVFEYVSTGLDPASIDQYHAELTVNFDQISSWFGSIPWQNDHTVPIMNCKFDLYSVLLHEIGHTLGWLSLIHHSPTDTPESIFGFDQYSGIDASLHVGPNLYPLALQPLITGLPLSPQINPTFSNSTSVLISNQIWLNDQLSPQNDPVYSGTLVNLSGYEMSAFSLLSHLDDQLRCYSERSRISPGDTKNYVMAPFSAKGILRRTFQDIEINTLLGLGYDLNTSYTSVTLQNSPPYSTRMAGYNNYLNIVFPETVIAEYSITNNVSTALVIDLSNDPTLVDDENDPFFVSPGSLVNYRGCGIGGNNHLSLSVTNSPTGDIITYVPRPNFYGRAQFGFRLFDGKEEGSYVIYTIDVEKGNNVNCTIGSNIVLNGDFEEGSEVRKLGSEEIISASVAEQDNMREGKLRAGIHFGDCHPYNYLSNNVTPYSSGDLIKESRIGCNGTISKSISGSVVTSFPGIGGSSPNPDAANGMGQRYRKIFGTYTFFNLCTDVEVCKRYVLEFDYFAKPFDIANGTNIPVTVAFTNTATYPSIPTYTYNTIFDITVINNSWEHVSIPFVYCGNSPASILSLFQTTASTGFVIDNLELQEDLTPLPLTVNISPSSPTICIGTSVSLSSTLDNGMCNVSYSWFPATGLSCTDCANPVVSPSTTTDYTLTVSDGCSVTSEQITVNVDNSLIDVSASQNTLCQGQISILTASGADSYSWSPAFGLSATTGGVVTANPSTTTTYTVTGTSIDGCTTYTEITIIVDNSLNLTITASDENLCPGESTTLEASGAVNYTWNPSSLTSNPITVSPSSSTTYTVIGTSAFGCMTSTSVNVTVDNSIINLTAVASEEIVCPGGTSVLTASGANTYSWEPGSFSGNPYTVNPLATTTYTVTGTSINGCTASTDETISVTENPNTLCCEASTLTLYDDQNSATIGTIPNNSVINVNGVFTVNTNLSLVACTLRMAPDARIEVMSGFNFSLTDCLIFSCTEMWDGIYSNPGAMLTIEGSRIEDAKNAVFSFQGGNYYLNDNTFNKNNISLLVDPFNTPHPGIVKNCIFDCTDQNSPTVGYVLKAPMAGDKSHFGIYCEKVEQISFGAISAQPNIFQNLEIGIHIKASNANIYRNNFNSITEPFCPPVFPSTCPVLGWAIWAKESKLLIGDNAGMSHENNISDCSNGIFLDGFCKYEIRKNNFTNILTPTENHQVSKCIFARFGYINILPSIGEIEDNTFVNFEAGIYYEANQMTYLKINRNRFGGFNTLNGVAIYLRQNKSHPIEIKNNFINFLPFMKGVYGIRVQNAVQSGNNVTIEQNTIKNVRHGIWVTNYDGINISDQNADYTSIGTAPAGIYYPNTLPSVFSVGIKVENCQNTNISNNLIQKAGPNPTISYTKLLYGISVETNGIGSTIVENEVKRLGKGLNFYGQPNAPLYVSCNAMYLNRTGLSLNNTYIGNQGSSSPLIAQDNQWTIPGDFSTNWLGAERTPTSPLTTWYSRSNSLPFFPLGTQMIPSFSPYAINFGNATGAPYNCSFGCANPPCLMVDGGKMIKKEDPFNLLNNEEKQMIDIQMYKLLKNNPSYLTSGTPDDSIFVNYVDSLENTNIGKIYRFTKQLEDGDTIASYNEITSVSPIMTAETNHKIVNEIYWRSWVHDIFEFSPADSAYLLSVAEQHPHQGGTAVYDARVMLSLDFYDYDDGDQQKSSNIKEGMTKFLSKEGEIKFVLYPNPTNGLLYYNLDINEDEISKLIIYSTLGEELISYELNFSQESGEIDISSFASGIYFFKYYINNIPVSTGPIIINK